MKVFESISALTQEITQQKAAGKTIGFVPTMGALHDGHCSLVARSKKENDITVVSIFVNPTQFNDKNDLKNYPRTFEKDSSLLESFGADFIFHPSEQEMYPTQSTEVWDFGQLDKVMEGAHRPGHFNGVAIIVKKLFEIVIPHKAYFGLKDFQQVAIIKELVKRTQFPIEIVECPIIREPDGLAMSSRNMLLSPEARLHAANISKALFEAIQLSASMEVDELKKYVTETINADPMLLVEYFEIVDSLRLRSIKSWDEKCVKVGCVAVKLGNIRLIDNVTFPI